MFWWGLLTGGIIGFFGAALLIASSDTFYHENIKLREENRKLRNLNRILKEMLEEGKADDTK